jgi:amidohydrolase
MSSEMIAFRRVLHSQPELSGAEYVTTEMLVERLRVEGLDPHVLKTGTGLVCDVPMCPNPSADAPIVALRADIDALAMDDLKDVPYKSQHPGVAHACGHDVHTAALLGAAITLLDERAQNPIDGTVRLIFEPAEETVPGGAVDVVNEGWLRDVDAIFGLHCDPRLNVGEIGLRVGPLTSASDHFVLHLTGPGGHTARPEQTVDLARWVGIVAAGLADAVRDIAPDCHVVLGAIHTGAAPNVIPSRAEISGTLRTANIEEWRQGREILSAAVTQLLAKDAAPHWSVEYFVGMPPVRNSAETTNLLHGVFSAPNSPVQVRETLQSKGADSFAWYQEHVPGTYIRLGTVDPTNPDTPQDLHSATFDVDERAIGIGSDVLVRAATAWLTQS